ncbi:polysaccharide deacetylase family protein [Bacillus aquiflavi]|uniref:polysaccharide deacetylase family protein n=1 Tax=Bacillus aquiflavi TaxID=2672567 RepID=UPI001CA95B18|nr:polysaccharide deacetylase family protein [Bacillus aquiflavi]UAC49422.1 polysaccharide deacetylase family protein [Bacillus aquiflavi]
MKKQLLQINIIAFILILSWWTLENPLTEQYLGQLKTKTAASMNKKEPLFQKINEKAKMYKILPQDAKIDRVWKGIPGYNGLAVDVEKSYEKMKEEGKFNESKLIYKQLEPKVKLKDLPPTAIYKGHPDKPMVSFLINVAWGNEHLSSMLLVLKKHNVKASFFLEGRWVKENPELAKMIADAGHEIGNHSYSHPDMKKLSSHQIKEEIEKTNKVIKATTGKTVKWFAPPSGSYRDEVVHIAADMGLGTVMWSVDTIDWQKPSPPFLINRVVSKVHNGAMILMHPTEPTAKALNQLIIELKEKDLQIDTVSQLLSEERIITSKSAQSDICNGHNE